MEKRIELVFIDFRAAAEPLCCEYFNSLRFIVAQGSVRIERFAVWSEDEEA